jgi:hypothetical protein
LVKHLDYNIGNHEGNPRVDFRRTFSDLVMLISLD